MKLLNIYSKSQGALQIFYCIFLLESATKFKAVSLIYISDYFFAKV